jgi:hypothetical protein
MFHYIQINTAYQLVIYDDDVCELFVPFEAQSNE